MAAHCAAHRFHYRPDSLWYSNGRRWLQRDDPTNVYETALFEQLDNKKVAVASVNLVAPPATTSKNEKPLSMPEYRNIWKMRYEVRPQREFAQRWNNAILIYGDPIDPTTGRVNRNLHPDRAGLSGISYENKPTSAASSQTSLKKTSTTSKDSTA